MKRLATTIAASRLDNFFCSFHNQGFIVWQLWEDPLVEHEHDRVVLRDGSAENGLEEAMCADGLANVAAKAKFGHELCRLEPSNVLGVVEEVLDHSETLADSNRQTRQNHLFEHYAVWVDAGQAPSRHKYHAAIVEPFEHEQRTGKEGYWGVRRRHAKAIVLQEVR